MKGYKHIIISFFIATYSLLVFPLVPLSAYNSQSITSTDEAPYHFIEVSKLICPQALIENNNRIPIAHYAQLIKGEIDEIFVSTQFIAVFLTSKYKNYLKKSFTIELNLPPEDIIYPFHTFW